MSQQPETATDRLVSIIQLIQLGRRTGVLTAKRGNGITLEKGTIAFIKGRITHSTVGRRSGSEALNWLTTWGTCRFTFTSSDSLEVNLPHASLPPKAPEDITTDTDPSLRPQRPTFGRQTEPIITRDDKIARIQKQHISSSGPIIPQRTRQLDSALQVIENMGLSRAHRRLLLLIDGQRSSDELARLMGRNENELYTLLHDLARATVIQLPDLPPYK